MRRRSSLGLLAACLAAITLFTAWTFYKGAEQGAGWGGVLQVWPYLLAGVATVAIVIVGFVWLALYSNNHGYDARAGRDRR